MVTSGRDRARRGRRLSRVLAAPVTMLALAGCETAGAGAPVAPAPMTVGSEAFLQGTLAPRYSCYGAKVHPPLNWSGVPQGTKSLAIIVDDSSAPITPSIYWLVFDIGPGTTDIQEGSLPTGARQAQNSRGVAAYDAPCPGGHPHEYRFTVYALNSFLTLPNGAPLRTAWTEIAAATIGRGRQTVNVNP